MPTDLLINKQSYRSFVLNKAITVQYTSNY